MGLTHFLIIFQLMGLPLSRIHGLYFAISGATAATKDTMSSFIFLRACTAFLGYIFTGYFTVS